MLLLPILGCYSLKREFETQGEQEIYWTKKLFKLEYKKQAYERFDGNILIISQNEIQFDNKILIVHCDDDYLGIFRLGIIYPQLSIGFEENNMILSEEELGKKSSEEKFLYHIRRNDTFSVSNIEELTYVNKSPSIKRFRFLSFKKGFTNPDVYFFELTNEKATKSTTRSDFIKNSTLTFYKRGWVML